MIMKWKIYIGFFLICKPSMLGEEFNKKFKLVEYSTIFLKWTERGEKN